jgi:hypothetical protein
MAKDDVYFQFPIAMLQGATETGKLTQSIVDYAIWHYGLSLWTKTPDLIDSLAEGYSGNRSLSNYNPQSLHHRMVLAAASRLSVSLRNVDVVTNAGRELHEKHGTKGAQCRIRADYLWTAYDEQWLLMRFRVLCAVLAGVGDRDAVRISTKRIQTLGAGFNSSKGVETAQLLSYGGTVHWLDELWYRNMFQFCKHGRYRWYSIRQESDEALAKVVRTKMTALPKKAIIDAKCI